VIHRFAAAAALALALAARAADPVAFVADVKGNATIEGDGRLGFLAELAPGSRLLLGTSATVAVTYAASGTEFTLSGPGEFLIGPETVSAEKGSAPRKRAVASLRDAATVTRVSRTATASLRMRGLAPDAAATRGVLEFPVDTGVASLQPTLRWRATGEDVTVRVADAEGKEVWRGGAKTGSVRTGMKLSPATRYTWTIATPQKVLAQARFETLPAEAITRVEKSRARAKSFSQRVLHAVVLQDAGATQEAREAWAALARERPDLPELNALATGR
jgi:hypothetical protein